MTELKICGVRKARGGICQREATVLTEEKGLICTRHYITFRRFDLVKKVDRICKADLCNAPIRKSELCTRHYQQIRDHGRILGIRRSRRESNEIVIENNIAKMSLYNDAGISVAETIFDAELCCVASRYKWGLNKAGYAKSTTEGLRFQHLVMGHPPEGMEVDHINRDKLDNRRQNLRFVSHQQNCMNSSMRVKNTSGVIGVRWFARTKKWVASIGVDGKEIHLGYFELKQDAIDARKEAERKYFGEYAPR